MWGKKKKEETYSFIAIHAFFFLLILFVDLLDLEFIDNRIVAFDVYTVFCYGGAIYCQNCLNGKNLTFIDNEILVENITEYTTFSAGRFYGKRKKKLILKYYSLLCQREWNFKRNLAAF